MRVRGTKFGISEIRCIVGMVAMVAVLKIFPRGERKELATALFPLAKEWKARNRITSLNVGKTAYVDSDGRIVHVVD